MNEKPEMRLINIGEGKFILCLDRYSITTTEEKLEVDKYMEDKFRNLQITNVCFLPFTVEVEK